MLKATLALALSLGLATAAEARMCPTVEELLADIPPQYLTGPLKHKILGRAKYPFAELQRLCRTTISNGHVWACSRQFPGPDGPTFFLYFDEAMDECPADVRSALDRHEESRARGNVPPPRGMTANQWERCKAYPGRCPTMRSEWEARKTLRRAGR